MYYLTIPQSIRIFCPVALNYIKRMSSKAQKSQLSLINRSSSKFTFFSNQSTISLLWMSLMKACLHWRYICFYSNMKDKDGTMIKREKELWVASELPIAPYCVLANVLLCLGGCKLSMGTSLNLDVLFPEAKMFVSSPLYPGELPTILNKVKRHYCWFI